MNCHRDIDSTTTADFITIPDYVVSDKISVQEKDIATSIHNLFTEMDHGYVNPTTEKKKDLVTENFDVSLWDNDSGYNEGNGHDDTGNAVFNEYMTWAVYDIFLKEHFPNYADEVGLNWSFQNDSRGFQYAQLFTQKLLNLYNSKSEEEGIKDLYPKLLQWTSEIQNDLSKPTIVSPKDSTTTKFSVNTKINISFSEPMKKVDGLSMILQDDKNQKDFMELTIGESGLKWSEDGKSIEFYLNLPNDKKYCYLTFNWWGTKNPIYSEKGVLLKNASYFKLIDE